LEITSLLNHFAKLLATDIKTMFLSSMLCSALILKFLVIQYRQLQIKMNLSNFSTVACSAAAIPYPTLFGADFLSIETTLVQNYSQIVHSGYYSNHGTVNVTDVSFCNVTMSYTHPGQNDTIYVQVYLPTDTWNGKFQMIGGGGWQAGLYIPSKMGMVAAVGEGYSTISTDAGLGSQVEPTDWALVSPGNVNLYLLENLASVSLNDAALIGKAVTTSFYGEAPKYSYFTGCSQGGRQGLMLAQRYPDAFDGIASSAPAINWSEFFMGDTWPSYFMNSLGVFPSSCEITAITDALLDACDGLDGLVDGIINDPYWCSFDPMTVIGQSFNCSDFNTTMQISTGAATLVEAIVSSLFLLLYSYPLWSMSNPD
jgi:S-formylglutathione hydrolase FrmB